MKMTFAQHLRNRQELLKTLDQLVTERKEKKSQNKDTNPPKK